MNLIFFVISKFFLDKISEEKTPLTGCDRERFPLSCSPPDFDGDPQDHRRSEGYDRFSQYNSPSPV